MWAAGAAARSGGGGLAASAGPARVISRNQAGPPGPSPGHVECTNIKVMINFETGGCQELELRIT